MNSAQRRVARRKGPLILSGGCYRQGYSGTTSYPDLSCLDGYMRDMDADGYDMSESVLPCAHCKPVEHAEWEREEREQDEDDADAAAADDDIEFFDQCDREGDRP